MIRALIFDCFGVLYIQKGQHFFETKIPNYHNLRRELASLVRQADYGFITQAEFITQLAELSGLDEKTIKTGIGGDLVRNEELFKYAAMKKKDGFKIGLLSNVALETINNYIPVFERNTLFDASVISGEVGMVKPFAEIYQLMNERLGVKAEECLFVDDSPDNCAGAELIGMKSVHYQNLSQAMREIANKLTA